MIVMKVGIEMIKSGDMECSNGQVAMFTKELMSLTCEMGMEKCIGKTEVIIKGIGPMEFSMVRVRSENIQGKFTFRARASRKGGSTITLSLKFGRKN